MRELLTGLVVVGAVLSVGVSSAAAKRTTIGQTGTPVSSLPSGQQLVDPYDTVPQNGRITSFQSRSTLGGSGIIDFEVLRPLPSGGALGGRGYLVVGETGDIRDPGDGKLDRYPADIPVRGGDMLGAYVVKAWTDAVLADGHLDLNFQPQPAVGQAIPIGFDDFSHGVNESATFVATKPRGKLDQSFTTQNGALGVAGANYLAQTFTAGRTGRLTQANLYLGAIAAIPPSPTPLQVDIETVVGGVPSGTILASASVPTQEAPGLLAWVSIPFHHGLAHVVKGTQYAIVISDAADSSSGFWYAGSGTPNAYSGGYGLSSDDYGTTWSPQPLSIDFETYVK